MSRRPARLPRDVYEMIPRAHRDRTPPETPAVRRVHAACGTRVRRTAGGESSARTPGVGHDVAGHRRGPAIPSQSRQHGAHPTVPRLTGRVRRAARRETGAKPARGAWLAWDVVTVCPVSTVTRTGCPGSQSVAPLRRARLARTA